MIVFTALINSESCKSASADCCIGKHPLYSKIHSSVRTSFHHSLGGYCLKVANPACMMIINLLIKLISCKYCLITVKNDYMISAINMGSIGCLFLTAKNACSSCSNSAHALSGSIDDVPFSLNLTGIFHIGLHTRSTSIIILYFQQE